MNKQIITILISLLIFGCSSDDSGGTFNGDVILRTQEDINSFGSNQYIRIAGRLEILANFSADDISDLTPLNSITVVDDVLYIASISNLVHLELNMSDVGGLTIENMQSTQSISFPYLAKITDTGLNVLRCDSLTTLNIPNLTRIPSRLSFIQNLKLADLSSLSNLTAIENENLEFTSIVLTENPLLSNIEGLSSVNSNIWYLNIDENNSLTSLNGLQGISLRDIKITWNENLFDYCGIGNFVSNGLTFDGDIYEDGSNLQVYENLYNPNIQDFINENCSN